MASDEGSSKFTGRGGGRRASCVTATGLGGQMMAAPSLYVFSSAGDCKMQLAARPHSRRRNAAVMGSGLCPASEVGGVCTAAHCSQLL